jgi:hypothetical protein
MYLATYVYEEADVYLHAFLTLEIEVGEWSASRLGRFTLGFQWVAYNSKAILRTVL